MKSQVENHLKKTFLFIYSIENNSLRKFIITVSTFHMPCANEHICRLPCECSSRGKGVCVCVCVCERESVCSLACKCGSATKVNCTDT